MTARHLTLILSLVATGAIAHDAVKDPQVQARMQMMKEIRQATATLGAMVKQPDTYSEAKADTARTALIDLADAIPAAFEDPATDPVSEADPAIWQNWDDFTAKADALGAAARSLDVTSEEGLAAGLREIGGTCGGCHRPYRL